MHGFLLVDKPAEWTSHDVVAVLRGMTGIRQIGHAGTLDPFATGLLVVGVGTATKQLDAVHAFDKEYVATIRFGATSDTDDCDGMITPFPNAPDISAAMLENVLQTFRGTIQQTPPMYSAKKVGGRKLYDLAREGKTVVREPVSVTVHEISIEEVMLPETTGACSPSFFIPFFSVIPAKAGIHDVDRRPVDPLLQGDDRKDCEQALTLRITCSTGTYIRALARDIGTALGTGAYCAVLRRTRIGPYRVEEAIGPKAFEKETWQERLVQPQQNILA